MITIQFERITKLLDPPFYVFREEPVGIVCDKLTVTPDGKFDKKRYILVGGKQCTCLGFLKKENCKHLKMLHDDFSWIEQGVPRDYAIEVVTNVIKECADFLPASAASWSAKLTDEGPDYVVAIDLEIKDKTRKQADRIVAFKKLSSKMQLAVVFKFGVE